MSFRAFKKALVAPYSAKVNNRVQTTRGPTLSLLAFLAYIPLVFIVPKSKPEQEPLKLGCMEYYDKMDDMEFAHLPLETQDKVSR